jgi:RecB family exonuclease
VGTKNGDAERPVFSASRISTYLTCPRQWYFKYDLGLESDDASWAAIVGQSYHSVLESWHRDGCRKTHRDRLAAFGSELRLRVMKAEAAGQVVNGFEGEQSYVDVSPDAAEIFMGYIEDKRNHVPLLLNEVHFEVEVKGTGKGYLFHGYIDQVRLQPDGQLFLVDLKSGKGRPNDFLLQLDFQLSLYAIACQKGRFATKAEPDRWFTIDRRPDQLAIARLRDYCTYKKNQFAPTIKCPDKTKVKNPETGRMVIRDIPNPKHTDGYKKGDRQGPVFYRTDRSEFDLRQAEVDLARVCASIRRREFFRRPAATGSCIGFCRYTAECTAERAEPI